MNIVNKTDIINYINPKVRGVLYYKTAIRTSRINFAYKSEIKNYKIDLKNCDVRVRRKGERTWVT